MQIIFQPSQDTLWTSYWKPIYHYIEVQWNFAASLKSFFSPFAVVQELYAEAYQQISMFKMETMRLNNFWPLFYFSLQWGESTKIILQDQRAEFQYSSCLTLWIIQSNSIQIFNWFFLFKGSFSCLYHNQASGLDFLIQLAYSSENKQSSVTCHLRECISLWKFINSLKWL